MKTATNLAIRRENLQRKRLVIGISGASGAQLGIDLLRLMQQVMNWETHLVISKGAEQTICQEAGYTVEAVAALATYAYALDDLGANIASGTFKTEGMVVIPCSMKTVAGVACGYSQNLLLRAADVTIKERRRLVLVTRESPLSSIHLRNMLCLSDMGAVVMPPVMTFYNQPQTIADMSRHIAGKVLDVFGLEAEGFARWGNFVSRGNSGRGD